MSAEVVDLRRFPVSHCWFCGLRLGAVFTSVRRRGIDLRVHPTCRPEAATVVVEDTVPAFVSELPIG